MTTDPLTLGESSAATLMAALRARAPGIAKRVADAEAAASLPAASVDELRDSGFFRVYQPRRFGGSELPMASVLPMVAELGESCGSTAWVSAVYQIHTWLLGFFHEAAQDAVFGEDPATTIAGVLQPRAIAERDGDAFRVSAASWPYASGCAHCKWFLLGGLVDEGAGPPSVYLFIVPRSEVTIHDDWDVSGLRGTGSCTVSIEACRVPETHAVNFSNVVHETEVSHRDAMWCAAPIPMLCLNVTGPALGVARCAVNYFSEHIANRTLPFSPAAQIESPLTHAAIARAQLGVDTAELLLKRGCESVRSTADARCSMPLTERNRVRVFASAAVQHCVAAINEVFLASGGTASRNDNPLQRWHRDVHAMAQHAALFHSNNLELWGASMLGQPLNSDFV